MIWLAALVQVGLRNLLVAGLLRDCLHQRFVQLGPQQLLHLRLIGGARLGDRVLHRIRAGGQPRYFAASAGSRSAGPVTATLPPDANSCCTLSEVNHSRNFTAPAVFGAADAMPQMNVPMAGPLLTCDGVAAKSIFPGPGLRGSSTTCAVPVYSVMAVQWPCSITAVSWLVSNAATPLGM